MLFFTRGELMSFILRILSGWPYNSSKLFLLVQISCKWEKWLVLGFCLTRSTVCLWMRAGPLKTHHFSWLFPLHHWTGCCCLFFSEEPFTFMQSLRCIRLKPQLSHCLSSQPMLFISKCLYLVLGTELKVQHRRGRCSTTGLQPQAWSMVLINIHI